MIMKSVPDATTRAVMLKTGEADISYALDGPEAEEIQRTPDDDGKAGLKVGTHRDVNDIDLIGSFAFRDTSTVGNFFGAVFPPWRYGTMLKLDGR